MIVDRLQKANKNTKIKKTGDSKYIYQDESDKAWFQYGMAYEGFTDLTRRKVSDKILRDDGFNIAKSQKYNGYQRGLASIVGKFFDKKFSGIGIKNKNISNKELVEGLLKPIINKLKKRKVLLLFKENI